MSNIEKELEKLLCYTMDRSVITGEDIDAVCTTQINNRIFAMVQAGGRAEPEESVGSVL